MYNKLLTEKIIIIFYLHLKAFKLNINKNHPDFFINKILFYIIQKLNEYYWLSVYLIIIFNVIIEL